MSKTSRKQSRLRDQRWAGLMEAWNAVAGQPGHKPSVDDLREYRRVALAWPPQRRHPEVAWEVHQMLADRSDRFEILDHLVADGKRNGYEVTGDVVRFVLDHGMRLDDKGVGVDSKIAVGIDRNLCPRCQETWKDHTSEQRKHCITSGIGYVNGYGDLAGDTAQVQVVVGYKGDDVTPVTAAGFNDAVRSWTPEPGVYCCDVCLASTPSPVFTHVCEPTPSDEAIIEDPDGRWLLCEECHEATLAGDWDTWRRRQFEGWVTQTERGGLIIDHHVGQEQATKASEHFRSTWQGWHDGLADGVCWMHECNNPPLCGLRIIRDDHDRPGMVCREHIENLITHPDLGGKWEETIDLDTVSVGQMLTVSVTPIPDDPNPDDPTMVIAEVSIGPMEPSVRRHLERVTLLLPSCPYCFKAIHDVRAITGLEVPADGDLSVCTGCKNVSVFVGLGFRARKLAPEDVEKVRGDTNAIAGIKEGFARLTDIGSNDHLDEIERLRGKTEDAHDRWEQIVGSEFSDSTLAKEIGVRVVEEVAHDPGDERVFEIGEDGDLIDQATGEGIGVSVSFMSDPPTGVRNPAEGLSAEEIRGLDDESTIEVLRTQLRREGFVATSVAAIRERLSRAQASADREHASYRTLAALFRTTGLWFEEGKHLFRLGADSEERRCVYDEEVGCGPASYMVVAWFGEEKQMMPVCEEHVRLWEKVTARTLPWCVDRTVNAEAWELKWFINQKLADSFQIKGLLSQVSGRVSGA